jgi:hypothetical protein
LLAAVAKLEERRQRHEDVKQGYMEKKLQVAQQVGACVQDAMMSSCAVLQAKDIKRLERELEAAKLRAERADIQAALHRSQVQTS